MHRTGGQIAQNQECRPGQTAGRNEDAIRRAHQQPDRVRRIAILAHLPSDDPLARVERNFLAELELKHRLPAIFGSRWNVEAGGLMSYAADLDDLTRRAATYIDKILKGAKPADLPVEQASKYQLVINLKTAKALGLDVPVSVLARADEVIE